MMPPGAGGQGSGNERSDASGLLEAGGEPWASTRSDTGEPEAPQGAVPGGVPLVPSPAVGSRTAPERSESSDLLAAGDQPWERTGPDSGEPEVPQGVPVAQTREGDPGDTPELPEDRVPVVRRDEEEQDTSAWDVPSDGLLWLAPFPVRARPEESERDRPAPDYALRDSTPWNGAPGNGYDTWRSAKWAEGSGTPVEDAPPLMCGGPNLTPAELAAMKEAERVQAEAEAAAAAEEEDDEAKAERSSADLLVRDNSAWGAGPATPPNGVIG